MYGASPTVPAVPARSLVYRLREGEMVPRDADTLPSSPPVAVILLRLTAQLAELAGEGIASYRGFSLFAAPRLVIFSELGGRRPGMGPQDTALLKIAGYRVHLRAVGPTGFPYSVRLCEPFKLP